MSVPTILTVPAATASGLSVSVLNTNTGYHLIGLDSTTKGEINISFDSEMAHSKKQLMSLLKEINLPISESFVLYGNKIYNNSENFDIAIYLPSSVTPLFDFFEILW